MAKLIVKQETSVPFWHSYRIGLLGSLLVLCTFLVSFGLVWWWGVNASPAQHALNTLPFQQQLYYREKDQYLDLLIEQANFLAHSSTESVSKSEQLIEQINRILGQLDALMTSAASLPSAVQKVVLADYQYQSDYWEGQLRFQSLRFDHLGSAVAERSDAPELDGETARFAIPPAGMELPAGFCTLSGPKACKPDAEVQAQTKPAS